MILTKLVNSTVRVDLDAIEAALLITRNKHALIPDNSREVAFAGVREFEDNFVGEGLVGVNLLVEGCSDYQVLLRHIQNAADVQSVVPKVALLDLKSSHCCFTALNFYLPHNVKTTHRITNEKDEVIHLSIVQIYGSRVDR